MTGAVLQSSSVRYGAVPEAAVGTVGVERPSSGHHPSTSYYRLAGRLAAAVILVLGSYVMFRWSGGGGPAPPAGTDAVEAAPAPAHLAGKGIRIIGAELPVAPFAGSARITAPAEGATCSAVLVFSVGTALTKDQYDNIAQSIVGLSNPQTGYVVVVVDPVPGFFVKFLPLFFANSVSMVKSKLSSWVGEACAGGVEHWVVGGHSAGGAAAYLALASNPDLGDAMFGLDPFYFTSVEDQKLAKPGMYWGFTNTTCSVDLDKSARNFYGATEATSHRVLYTVDSIGTCPSFRGSGSGCLFGHCSFLSLGTCNVCPIPKCPNPLPKSCKTPPPDDFYSKVAYSFTSLVSALQTGKWGKEGYWGMPGQTQFTVYTDDMEAPAA